MPNKGLKLNRRQPNGLTAKQKIFADAILDDPKITAEAAALQAYDTDKRLTAAAIASENLSKPNILKYLTDNAKEAEYVVVEVMNEARTKPEVGYQRLAGDMANSLLDRVYGRATQRVEQSSTSVSLTIDLTSSSSAE